MADTMMQPAHRGTLSFVRIARPIDEPIVSCTHTHTHTHACESQPSTCLFVLAARKQYTHTLRHWCAVEANGTADTCMCECVCVCVCPRGFYKSRAQCVQIDPCSV